MLIEGDKVVFLRDGHREEAEIHPNAYGDLKTLAHIPLGLEALLGDVDGTLDEARLASLRNFRGHINAAMREFSSRYGSASVDRQKQIVTASTTLIDGALERRTLNHATYLQFARGVGPLLLANANEAGRVEIDAIHKQVSIWRSTMSPAEWARLRVVVIGSHMARDRALEMQYFQRLLDEPGEGRRIVFAEGLWEESKALDLDATHILDAEVGESFFGDPARMHRDLLSDAAASYLLTLFPAKR